MSTTPQKHQQVLGAQDVEGDPSMKMLEVAPVGGDDDPEPTPKGTSTHTADRALAISTASSSTGAGVLSPPLFPSSVLQITSPSNSSRTTDPSAMASAAYSAGHSITSAGARSPRHSAASSALRGSSFEEISVPTSGKQSSKTGDAVSVVVNDKKRKTHSEANQPRPRVISPNATPPPSALNQDDEDAPPAIRAAAGHTATDSPHTAIADGAEVFTPSPPHNLVQPTGGRSKLHQGRSPTSGSIETDPGQTSPPNRSDTPDWESERNPLQKIKELEKQLQVAFKHKEKMKGRYETALRRAKQNISEAMEKITEQSGRLRELERKVETQEHDLDNQKHLVTAGTAQQDATEALLFNIDPKLNQCYQRVLQGVLHDGKQHRMSDEPEAVAKEYIVARDEALSKIVRDENEKAVRRALKEYQLKKGGPTSKAGGSRRGSTWAMDAAVTGTNTGIPRRGTQVGFGDISSSRRSTSGGQESIIRRVRSVHFDNVEDNENLPDLGEEHGGKNIGIKLSNAVDKDFRRVSLSDFGVKERRLQHLEEKNKALQFEVDRITKQWMTSASECDNVKRELTRVRHIEENLRLDLRKFIHARLENAASSKYGNGQAAAGSSQEGLSDHWRAILKLDQGEEALKQHEVPIDQAGHREATLDLMYVGNRQASPDTAGVRLPQISPRLVSRGGATSMTAPTRNAGLTPRAPPDPIPQYKLHSSGRAGQSGSRNSSRNNASRGTVSATPKQQLSEDKQEATMINGTKFYGETNEQQPQLAAPHEFHEDEDPHAHHLPLPLNHQAEGSEAPSRNSTPATHPDDTNPLQSQEEKAQSVDRLGVGFRLFLSCFVHDVGAIIHDAGALMEKLTRQWDAFEAWSVKVAQIASEIIAQEYQNSMAQRPAGEQLQQIASSDDAGTTTTSQKELRALQAEAIKQRFPPMPQSTTDELLVLAENISSRKPTFETNPVVQTMLLKKHQLQRQDGGSSTAAPAAGDSAESISPGASRSTPSLSSSMPHGAHHGAATTTEKKEWEDELELMRHCWMCLAGFLQQHVSHFHTQLHVWHRSREDWMRGSGKVFSKATRSVKQAAIDNKKKQSQQRKGSTEAASEPASATTIVEGQEQFSKKTPTPPPSPGGGSSAQSRFPSLPPIVKQ